MLRDAKRTKHAAANRGSGYHASPDKRITHAQYLQQHLTRLRAKGLTEAEAKAIVTTAVRELSKYEEHYDLLHQLKPTLNDIDRAITRAEDDWYPGRDQPWEYDKRIRELIKDHRAVE